MDVETAVAATHQDNLPQQGGSVTVAWLGKLRGRTAGGGTDHFNLGQLVERLVGGRVVTTTCTLCTYVLQVITFFKKLYHSGYHMYECFMFIS